MTEDELIDLVTEELKGLSSQFETADYTNAVGDAERDTGWELPQASDFKIKWLKERMKRHLFSYLMDQSLYKFKYKNISLDNRFASTSKRVDAMDKAFELIQEEYIYEFAGVSSYNMFPHQIDSGFSTESQTGRDTTYSTDQEIIINPSENS